MEKRKAKEGEIRGNLKKEGNTPKKHQ